MNEMLTSVAAWPLLLIALLIWGFAPGLVIRVLSLAFWSDDPRRSEMRAELNAVPRWERPFWVAQQAEVATCEGLGPRLRWAAAGQIIDRWHLASGVDRNRMYPDTFQIPDEDERAEVEPGDRVKLVFETKHGPGEKMWVTVVGYERRGRLVGTLDNYPLFMPRLYPQDQIKFGREHIVDVIWSDEEPDDRPAARSGPIDSCVCCGEHVHMSAAERRVLEEARNANETSPGN